MGLLHAVHREVAGAWRSLRYDMQSQVDSHRRSRLLTAETTEMARHDVLHRGRPRQRLVAMGGVALLVAGGAAGTYLAVAGSLTALTADTPLPAVAAAPEPVVAVVPSVPQVSAPITAPPRRDARKAAPDPAPVPARPIAPPPAGPAPTSNRPESTPTPTASPSASPTAEPSGSASPSAPTASPSEQKTRRWGGGR